MERGRLYNKRILSNTGVGLEPTSVQTRKYVAQQEVQATTASNIEYSGEDDSSTTLTGSGNGGSGLTPPPRNSPRWGYTSPSGSRIELNDSAGSESIEMVHNSGAGISVDPDGGVYITSTSGRGAGVGAPRGDYYISAGGDVVISGGGSISITTGGDLTIDVGGTLNIKCGSYKLVTNNQEETIDGSASRSVTNDQSEMIGGIDRRTVAGDSRLQVSGSKYLDVGGQQDAYVDGNIVTGKQIGRAHV